MLIENNIDMSNLRNNTSNCENSYINNNKALEIQVNDKDVYDNSME